MTVVDGAFDNTLAPEEQAAAPLAGGIAGMGFQCGQVWGAALAAGAQAYRLYGPGPGAEAAAVIAAQRLVESFRGSYKSIDCRDVIQMDWQNVKAAQVLKFFLRGGPARCLGMTAGYSRAAFREIDAAFANGHLAPAPPVSCAAVLARKMGASEMQAVMAAGLAGGIGLSGGACGALGAAIWILTMNAGGEQKFDLNSPLATETIDRFVEATEINFECSEIVGRRFQDVHDHAAYVRGGGCAKIVEALANTGKHT